MRKCSKCSTTMIEDLNLLGGFHGERLELGGRFTKGLINKITVKAAVCPECGSISFYTDNIDNVKKLLK